MSEIDRRSGYLYHGETPSAFLRTPEKNYTPVYIAFGVAFGVVGMVLAIALAMVIVMAIATMVIGGMTMFGIIYALNGKVEK